MTDSELPDRRKYADKQLAKHASAVEDRLRGFFTKALVAFAILGLTSAGSLFGFGLVLKEQNQVSKDIQTQRYDTIFQNCEQQNLRHDRAIAKARKILPKQSRTVVVLLVDELQPYVPDCVELAKSRVQGNADVE